MELPLPVWFFVAVVGACIGSFLTLITFRLPRDEPVGLSRSRCPACLHTLGVRELVPVFSWVLSAGKCRHCCAKVNIRYPLTELACAACAVLAVQHFGLTLQALALAGLGWCFVAILVTDLEHTIILDEVQVAMVLLAVLYHYTLGSDAVALGISALVGLGMGLALKYGFLYLRRKDGLGMGDVKLLFGIGLWLGNVGFFVPFLFFSGLLGVVFGLVWRLAGRGAQFPFGPALMAALCLCLFWPQSIAYFWRLYGIDVAPFTN